MRLDYRTARLADILDISGMISSFAQHIWRVREERQLLLRWRGGAGR